MSITYDVVGQIIAYETGELEQEEMLALFSHLIQTGRINSLQGHYQRQARALLDAGLI